MKQVFVFRWAALVVSFGIIRAIAGWEQVVPAIQYIRSDGPGSLHHFSDSIAICYVGDSLEWPAQELADRLSRTAVIGVPKRINSIMDLTHVRIELPGMDQILLTCVPSMVDSVNWVADAYYGVQTHRLLEQDEAYGVWVREPELAAPEERFEKFVSFIIANRTRGILFGIESFDQALPPPPIPEFTKHAQSASIMDFPTFPRRIIGEPFDLNSTSPWPTSTAHADAILEGARDLLLQNKGNGFVQFGKSPGASTIFQRLAIGDTFSEHPDTWEDLGMDWYQGTGSWGGSTEAQKKRANASAYIYKEVHFRGINAAGTNIGIFPDSTEYPQTNFGFESFTQFERWNPAGLWTINDEGGNFFALLVVRRNGTHFQLS